MTMELLLLIAWGFCGVLGAVIAPQRGRDAASWFFLGLFFGIFAILLLLVLPSVVEPAPAARAKPIQPQHVPNPGRGMNAIMATLLLLGLAFVLVATIFPWIFR
jgi:cytochrome bd-type quinol oxidase subunit 2